MSKQKLTDGKIYSLFEFTRKSNDFRVEYLGAKFVPKVHRGAKKIWFIPECSDIHKTIYDDSPLYPFLLDQLIVAGGLNNATESAIADNQDVVTEEAIADKLTLNPSLVAGILTPVSHIENIDQRVTDIEYRLDHGYSPLISDLQAEILRLKDVVKQCCIGNIKKAVEAEGNRLFSSIIILHFSRNDIQYQAKWDENDLSTHNTFVLTTRLSPSDPEDFMYQIEYDHTVGFVEVPKNPLWSNDTFITVAKIAINAFLDGMRSGSELF